MSDLSALRPRPRSCYQEGMPGPTRVASRALAACAWLAAGAYVAYVVVAWRRHGHPPVPTSGTADDRLDQFMPLYDVVERHHIRVAAPAHVTLAAAREMDISQAPIVRAIFKGREWLTVCAVEPATSVEGHDAVVLGSGVYDGTWTDDATAFVRRQAPTLATMPVWLFSVGSFGDQHPVIGSLMRKEPKEIGELEQALHPRDYRVFAGVINVAHWPTWARLLFQALGGRDGDNRSWTDIEAWADQIAEALDRRTIAPTRP